MRLLSCFALLLCTGAAASAHAGSDTVQPRVGYIPAPSASAAGRPAVMARLRQLGREESQTAREMAEYNCPDYRFEAKVLLDTPVLYSLELASYRTCEGRATQGGSSPLLFDMQAGREYDIGRLYRVRIADGALLAPLRKLVARKMDPKEQEMTRQELDQAVDQDLARGKPLLFVTKTGIRVWPEASLVWLDDVTITWAELRPYLNAEEAKRLGWIAAAPAAGLQ